MKTTHRAIPKPQGMFFIQKKSNFCLSLVFFETTLEFLYPTLSLQNFCFKPKIQETHKHTSKTLLARLLGPFSINKFFIDKSLTFYEVSRRLFCHSQQLFLNKLVVEQHQKVLSTSLTLVFANFAFALCIHCSCTHFSSLVSTLLMKAFISMLMLHVSIYPLQSCVNMVFRHD